VGAPLLRFLQGRVRCCRYHGGSCLPACIAPTAHGKKRHDACQGKLFGEETRRAFWQARFYDFNVWTTKKRVEKLGYMHRRVARALRL
jgi:hypothetical protein